MTDCQWDMALFRGRLIEPTDEIPCPHCGLSLVVGQRIRSFMQTREEILSTCLTCHPCQRRWEIVQNATEIAYRSCDQPVEVPCG